MVNHVQLCIRKYLPIQHDIDEKSIWYYLHWSTLFMPFQCVFYIYTSQLEKLIYGIAPNIIINYVQLWSMEYQPVQWLNILFNQEWVTLEPNSHFDTYVIPDQMWNYRFASTWCFTQTFWYFWLYFLHKRNS